MTLSTLGAGSIDPLGSHKGGSYNNLAYASSSALDDELATTSAAAAAADQASAVGGSSVKTDKSQYGGSGISQLGASLRSNGQAPLSPDDKVKCVVDFSSNDTVMHVFLNFCADELHSLLMFVRIVFWANPIDMLFAWLISGGSTCFYYYYSPPEENAHPLVFNLNWTLIAIALVFPLTMTLTETFRRRESALQQLTNLKVSLLSLFMAHCDCDWYTLPTKPDEEALSGRSDPASKEGGRLSPTHAQEVLATASRFIDFTYTVLSAPRVSQAKHFYTTHGQQQRKRVQEVQLRLDDCVVALYHELSKFGEKLKAAGLPAGEKSRITAFENSLYAAYMQLRTIKEYRSPMGLRAYARVFILLTPVLFGPYYALVAQSTSLAWSICLACITSSAMQGLFNLRSMLEDPFSPSAATPPSTNDPFSLLLLLAGDTINLEVELDALKQDLRLVLENRSTEDIHRLFTDAAPP